MRLLFLFLDGVGLGKDDPEYNPLARVTMPNLEALLGEERLLAKSLDGRRLETERASLLALDACMGVEGLPQSASGQATLLTGVNIPAAIGYHYGPKPNPSIAEYLEDGTLFSQLRAAGKSAALLNAYPPRYFEAIRSGKRLFSAIPQAVSSAGIYLMNADDLFARRALSADFTGRAWRDHLDYPEAPLFEPQEAGETLARLASGYDLAFFEYWLTDYAGHKQDQEGANDILVTFDRMLGGLLSAWNDEEGLILITSDHGNMEDLSTRRHTDNPVPALVIGAPPLREQFTSGLCDLSDVAPGILELIL